MEVCKSGQNFRKICNICAIIQTKIENNREYFDVTVDDVKERLIQSLKFYGGNNDLEYQEDYEYLYGGDNKQISEEEDNEAHSIGGYDLDISDYNEEIVRSDIESEIKQISGGEDNETQSIGGYDYDISGYKEDFASQSIGGDIESAIESSIADSISNENTQDNEHVSGGEYDSDISEYNEEIAGGDIDNEEFTTQSIGGDTPPHSVPHTVQLLNLQIS